MRKGKGLGEICVYRVSPEGLPPSIWHRVLRPQAKGQ